MLYFTNISASVNDLITLNLQCIVLSFKLYSSKDPVISNTAAATIRQIVCILFDRVHAEDAQAGSY